MGQVSVQHLLAEAKKGRYAVPAGKHHFGWSADRVQGLAEAVVNGWPLPDLILEPANDDALSGCEALYGLALGEPQYILRRGHIRLSALAYAFCAPDVPLTAVGETRYLFFVSLAEKHAELVQHTPVLNLTGQGFAAAMGYFGGVERQYRDHLFPLSVIGEGAAKTRRWFDGYWDYWRMLCDQPAVPGFGNTQRKFREASPRIEAITQQLLAVGSLLCPSEPIFVM